MSETKSMFKYIIKKINLKFILRIIKHFIRKYKIIIFYIYLKRYLAKIENMNWRLIIALFTFPIIFIQLYELIIIYLQFSTQISVEISNINDINNEKLIQELPAITICNENIFKE